MTGFSCSPNTDKVEEGDIIFQTSKSKQGKYIAIGTMSQWTHCGIVHKRNGQWQVLEAVGPVKFTPLDKWIARGLNGHYAVKRLKGNRPKLNYTKYLGKAYDTKFEWSDRKMYCSELVWKVYHDAGVDLCEKRTVESYLAAKALRGYMRKRGISPDEYVVSPSDLYNSDKLKSI